MQKAKRILNIELAAGFCFWPSLWRSTFTFTAADFVTRSKPKQGGAGLALVLLIAHGVCWHIKGYRLWLYAHLIGIELPEESTTLVTVLGDPFFKTYVIFASIFGAAMLAVICYVNHLLTKPSRIFY